MSASDKAKQWNDQWWKEVVKQKKTALPTRRHIRKKKKPATKP